MVLNWPNAPGFGLQDHKCLLPSHPDLNLNSFQQAVLTRTSALLLLSSQLLPGAQRVCAGAQPSWPAL